MFTPINIFTSLSFTYLRNDAEKYIGESKSIIYDYIENIKLKVCNSDSIDISKIKNIKGNFNKNDIIDINDIAKGITDYSSKDLEKIKGKKGKIAVKSENIVLK